MLRVFVDTETTGLDTTYNEIIQVGFAWRTPAGKMVSMAWDVQPPSTYWDHPRADEALRHNGFTKERIGKAPRRGEVAGLIGEVLYDLEIIYAEVKFHGFFCAMDRKMLSRPPYSFPESWGVDVFELATLRFHRRQSLINWIREVDPPDLEELLQGAHDAEVDAKMTLLLFEWLAFAEAYEHNIDRDLAIRRSSK